MTIKNVVLESNLYISYQVVVILFLINRFILQSTILQIIHLWASCIIYRAAIANAAIAERPTTVQPVL